MVRPFFSFWFWLYSEPRSQDIYFFDLAVIYEHDINVIIFYSRCYYLWCLLAYVWFGPFFSLWWGIKVSLKQLFLFSHLYSLVLTTFSLILLKKRRKIGLCFGHLWLWARSSIHTMQQIWLVCDFVCMFLCFYVCVFFVTVCYVVFFRYFCLLFVAFFIVCISEVIFLSEQVYVFFLAQLCCLSIFLSEWGACTPCPSFDLPVEIVIYKIGFDLNQTSISLFSLQNHWKSHHIIEEISITSYTIVAIELRNYLFHAN